MSPVATVIVPVFDGERVITEQLEALKRQTRRSDLEIIVVDDGSRDRTAELVNAWVRATGDAAIRLVRRDRRGGPNAARNTGLRLAQCELVLFCDGDDVVDERWASAMMNAYRPGAILAGRYFLLGGDPADPKSWLVHKGKLFGRPFAPGGNLGVGRSLAMAIGGFDESITLGGTEVEFCIRAQLLADATVVGVDDSVVNYRLPTGAARFSRAFRRERGYAYIERRYGDAINRRGVRAYKKAARHMVRSFNLMFSGRPFRDELAAALGRLGGLVCWAIYFRFRQLEPTLMTFDHPNRG